MPRNASDVVAEERTVDVSSFIRRRARFDFGNGRGG